MDQRQNELVDYFIEETNKKFERLEEKVDMLLEFKWQIISGAVVFSALITIVIQVLSVIWQKN